MKKFLIIFIILAFFINTVGCVKSSKENKEDKESISGEFEAKDTVDPNSISVKIADEIENLSGSVYLNEVLYVDWQSGKDYGTHTIDTYTSNNNNSLLFDINKDGSLKKISISNSNASMDAVYSLVSLIVCILNNDSLDFTDDEMHEVGYGIMGENGEPGEKPFSLEKRNFKVSYLNEVSDDLETRNLLFYVQFT